jgi:uncharacterized protein (DUF433 family)
MTWDHVEARYNSVDTRYRSEYDDCKEAEMIAFSPGMTAHPDVRLGKPVLRGTRVLIDMIVARLAARMAMDKIAEKYGITPTNVYDALQYAARHISEEQVWVTA